MSDKINCFVYNGFIFEKTYHTAELFDLYEKGLLADRFEAVITTEYDINKDQHNTKKIVLIKERCYFGNSETIHDEYPEAFV